MSYRNKVLSVSPSVLAAQQMAGHRGGRQAAIGEKSAHHASLRLQQRVLECLAGESLCQVTTLHFIPPE